MGGLPEASLLLSPCLTSDLLNLPPCMPGKCSLTLTSESPFFYLGLLAHPPLPHVNCVSPQEHTAHPPLPHVNCVSPQENTAVGLSIPFNLNLQNWHVMEKLRTFESDHRKKKLSKQDHPHLDLIWPLFLARLKSDWMLGGVLLTYEGLTADFTYMQIQHLGKKVKLRKQESKKWTNHLEPLTCWQEAATP
jgi:hypothetical protein